MRQQAHASPPSGFIQGTAYSGKGFQPGCAFGVDLGKEVHHSLHDGSAREKTEEQRLSRQSALVDPYEAYPFDAAVQSNPRQAGVPGERLEQLVPHAAAIHGKGGKEVFHVGDIQIFPEPAAVSPEVVDRVIFRQTAEEARYHGIKLSMIGDAVTEHEGHGRPGLSFGGLSWRSASILVRSGHVKSLQPGGTKLARQRHSGQGPQQGGWSA